MFAPFRGLLFDPAVVGDVAAATSPPYDVIAPGERRALAEQSPYNVVRLLLPDEGAGQYQAAGALFSSWRSGGALRPDPIPQYYLYEMEWQSEGTPHLARGVVGSLVVEPLGSRILPHEATMAGTRADRYAVMESMMANLDPIVALSASPRLGALLETDGLARVKVTAGSVTHRLSDITDEARIAQIAREVAAHAVSIADGHHRYTTALAFAGDRGGGGWDAIMAVVAPAQGSGLTVAPYHRFLEDTLFDPEAVADAFFVESAAPRGPQEPGTLVVVANGLAWLLTPRTKALAGLADPLRVASAAVARDVLYPLLGVDETAARYSPNAADVIARAADGGTGVLVAAVTEHAIAAASEAGIRFPQKTTYFTPKPRAGLVIRAFDVADDQPERRP